MSRTKDAANWSDSDIDRLRRMWSEGYQASDIAGALGRGSRSAVLGKVRRLGLPYRRTPTAEGRGPTNRKAGKQRPERAMPFTILAMPLLPTPKAGDAKALKGAAWVALPGTVSLADLEPGMCKWPIGETGPYLFCGCPTHGVYCEQHAAIATGRVPASEDLQEAA